MERKKDGDVKWSRVPRKEMKLDEEPREPNPRQGANPFSVAFFTWTLAIFRRPKEKGSLELKDLCAPLTEDEAKILGDRLERHWNEKLRESSPEKPPRLLFVMFRTFWREFLLIGVLDFLSEPVLRVLQPVLLGRLLLYFNKDSVVSYEEAWMLAVGIVLLQAATAVLVTQYSHKSFHTGMKMKVAACSLMFRKALRLSKTALGQTATGQIVNLLANDVSRFELVAYFIHFIWASVLVLIFVSWIVIEEMGTPGLFGIAVVLVVCPIQSYTARLTSRFRGKTAFRTDHRVRLMSEIIDGIQAIKMYAWEKPFGALIAKARIDEIKWIRRASFIRGIYMTFNMFTTRMALFCALLAVTLAGSSISSDRVFVVSALFTVLAQAMTGTFVRALAECAECWVSTNRIQTFLLREEFSGRPSELPMEQGAPFERKSFNHTSISEEKLNPDEENTIKDGILEDEDLGVSEEAIIENEISKPEPGTILVENASASWVEGGDVTLNKINLRAEPGSLVAVIGAVGSGKSSLIQALLGELPWGGGGGGVEAWGVSYSSQEPWVFSGSVRENVVFGRPFERRRYNQVLKACCLLPDLKRMRNGDATLVGERGGALSGGQKARLTLARAAYAQHVDAYLLDEPLAALDVNVAKHVFDECVDGLLRGTTRVLVTNQLHLLRNADLIVVMNNGSILTQGTFDQLIKSQGIFSQVVGEPAGDDLGTDHEDRPETPLKSILRQISSTSQQSLQAIKDDAESIYQASETEKEDLANEEVSDEGAVSFSTYKEFLLLGASIFVIFFAAFLFIAAQVAASAADTWVAFWITTEQKRAIVEDEEDHELMTTETCILIYGLIILALLVLAMGRSFLYYIISMRASINLHEKMFKSIVRAPMYFFSWNPAGRILNRFARDLANIDENLPKVALDVFQFTISMAACMLVAAYVNPLFLIPVAVMGFISHKCRRRFIVTSRQIKRLENIARSPVYSLLADVLNSLPTVRSMKAEKMLLRKVEEFQDTHSAAWYLYFSISHSYGFTLDLFVVVFIAFITFNFLLIDQTDANTSAMAGLAITQIMMMTALLNWAMRESAEMENTLTSVERVLEYTKLEQEPEPVISDPVPKNWPTEGCVYFDGTSLRYTPDQPLVLKNLVLQVEPRFKVGIVGRTGAGKSSLINALFRLAPLEGSVQIDSVDTGSLTLEDLRTKISIIPQDPVLFSGTLRYNLDPFGEYPDYQLWKALEDVELKDVVTELAGLESPVAAGGSNWSVGQRQLLCLARTILKKNKVLVLDEATANVDPQTDALIQATIRKQFKECTVLTVAHRLNTIMDSDRVLVMADGKLMEYGSPYELLQVDNGIFRRMVDETGFHSAKTLEKVAKEKFERDLEMEKDAVTEDQSIS
ncbi:probable multidrug resistance-associated protein lethal(2)03659 [Neocloeon triangulifer]|uniref:probable multidrug resistance-associated protein lethal(2)03659 n=1 Tax=Neocloeon triangulifer TaxID=2078957 RepID=UPI00286F4A7C|nr:probable multidrug resistance-associated protein lethal(2)03659 [Neocloeon triangulifer]XP_059490471.1 probable multidrug resistance-associated protein lethal(2)03659 [Neocloeon triangulifer]